MKDPLFEATRALREFGKPSSNTAQFTRARVLASLRGGQVRKRKQRWVFGIPLAALAIGSMAMAATGGYLPAPVQHWVAEHTAIAPKATVKRFRVAPRASFALQPAALSNDTPASSIRPPEAQTVAGPAGPTTLPDTVDSAHRVEPAPSKVTSDQVAFSGSSSVGKPRAVMGDMPVSEEEFQRYRAAHEAHFNRKDPAAALAAWSDYLTHSPTGRLAVEARYNRALCLLKLGRVQEARMALRPFTAGDYGAYRQGEARNLIATLDADAGS
jgi:hypothetical protein